MAERLGSGEWSFEVQESWAKIPDEIVLGDCAAVGVDSKDNVYAFNRGDHPVAVFDKDGNLLRTWGEGLFPRPHGVHVAPYTCNIGGKWLQVKASLRVTGPKGEVFETESPAALKRASKISETQPTWTWTDDDPRKSK